MNEIKPGSIIYTNNPPVEIKGDMTLRDYFAAKALQAMIQASATVPEDDEHSYISAVYGGVNTEMSLRNGLKEPPEPFTWAELLCVESYEIADQMLKARIKAEL